MPSSTVLALAPLLLLAIGVVVYALVDLARSPDPRWLPRWGWTLICLLSIPFGAVAYLVLGRQQR
ncbi:PLDc N-terminal domain-containing protein [Blastococcus atacamensis]|uniref:PLDc N-terminal domain-containing protein n=1 Tax=Blastococcus atacamensis TaxID=2070508 RepID=UPI000CECAEAF|nr:PLDc N-terminal domain-containing protein [Blastococcus atacamensis]